MKKQLVMPVLLGLAWYGTAGDVWGGEGAAATLQVKDAWVREAPPGTQVLAAYMELKNKGAADVKIVGMTSPEFHRVELHETVQQDGVARMVARPDFNVPAKKSIHLKPGGHHVMLITPHKPPVRAGDKIALKLALDNGTTLDTVAVVRKGAAGKDAVMQHDGHQNHDMHNMQQNNMQQPHDMHPKGEDVHH
jgi:copper(I)-binding protein